MSQFPWYTIITPTDGLEQGDFIAICPVLEPIYSPETSGIRAKVKAYNVIILTQSCDLIQNKVDLVLVCPYWGLSQYESRNPWFQPAKNKEKVRQGLQPNYYLLNQCELEGFENEFLLVDFRHVFTVPFEYLMAYVTEQPQRLRLLSPYKEHLAQAYARFTMRIGLPEDIPAFT